MSSDWRARLRWSSRLPGLVAAGSAVHGDQQSFALVAPFLRAAIGIGIVLGFGIGAALAIALALHVPLGAWWPALVQAHGRAQLVGFVGLMILGTGLHFFPRLRGTPLPEPQQARTGLGLVTVGVVVQALGQSIAAMVSPVAGLARIGLPAGALLQLAGATMIVRLLWRLTRLGPSLGERGGLTSILPLLGVGFAAFWLALFADAASALQAELQGLTVIGGRADAIVTDALLDGFGIGVAMAVSARLLPISLGVQVVKPAWLSVLAAVLGLGVIARVAADASGSLPLLAASDLGIGLACLTFPLLSGVPIGTRRAIRRSDPPALVAITFAPNLAIRSAFAWLFAAGVLFAMDGGAVLAGGSIWPPVDAPRHAIGAGFLTLLIFGVGARMFPGFARKKPRPSGRLFASVLLANAAAVCRVVPLLLTAGSSASGALGVAFGLSGALEIVALLLFAREVWPYLSG